MAKIKLEFDGFSEMIKEFERMEKDVRPVVNKALKKSFEYVTDGIQTAIPQHRRSGRTEDSLITDPNVLWSGNVAEIPVGFKLSNGGLASQFLIYGAKASITGVPYRAPDMKLYNAILGSATKKKIAEIQKEVFEGEIAR